MKIEFVDGSYIDCHKSDHPGKIIIIISAKDTDNPLKKINNTVEITIEDFNKMLIDVA